jgi:hypothetical protein
VLQVNGGYLIVNALDVLRQPFSWDALKRVIKTGEVKIEDPDEFYGFSTAGLRLEPLLLPFVSDSPSPPSIAPAIKNMSAWICNRVDQQGGHHPGHSARCPRPPACLPHPSGELGG